LPRGVHAESLTVEFRPKFRLADQRFVGTEVLARGYVEELGNVLPAEFIGSLIRMVCRQLSCLARRRHRPRFPWIPTNVREDVRKPRSKVKVWAFAGAEVAAIAGVADKRTAEGTGLRTRGELVFPEDGGKPIDYDKWRARVCEPLLKKPG